MSAGRVAIIGLDCAAPEIVFGDWMEALPNLSALIRQGTSGKLRSVDPPITVPAWSCMASSMDPGQLGVYGFRNRHDYSYDGMSFATSRSIQVDRVWDIAGRAGKHVIVLGVPQTYPPQPVNGELVSCFLTPDPRANDYTYPPDLKAEIEDLVGDYQVDVRDFRSNDRDRILHQVYEMTEQRFAVAQHLLETRPWDLFWMVEIGVDRMHHAFWRYLDPAHPRYEPNSPYHDAIQEYYRLVDGLIGDLLLQFAPNDTVFVVSDHGARAMEGGVCVNDWLVREGYLTLAEPVSGVTAFSKARVDWSKSRVWGEGGYYCRLFLNVEGREPTGTVSHDAYEALRSELIVKLEALTDPHGRPMGTRVYRPEDLYQHGRRGIVPDLLVYFGDLGWRSIGSLGHDELWTFENDTGPDDANHARDGVVIMRGPGVPQSERGQYNLLDIAPTVLRRLGLDIPSTMRGRSLLSD